jgi:hypothetical protein
MVDAEFLPICKELTLQALRNFFGLYMRMQTGPRKNQFKTFNAINSMIHAISWLFKTTGSNTTRLDIVKIDDEDVERSVDIKTVLAGFLKSLETAKADDLRKRKAVTTGGDQLGNCNELNGKKEYTVEQYIFLTKLCAEQWSQQTPLLSITHLAYMVLLWNLGLRPDSVASLSYSMVSNKFCTYFVHLYIFCTSVHILYTYSLPIILVYV